VNHVELKLNGTGFGSLKIDGVEAQFVRAVTLKAHVGDLTEVRIEYIADPFSYEGPAYVHHEMPDLVDDVVRKVTNGYRAGHDFVTLNAHVARAIDIAANRALAERKDQVAR
jgi:hypothetical protein